MGIADTASAHPSTRQALRDRTMRFVSPDRDDQIARRAARGRLGGRPPACDAERDQQRNGIARCCNRLKQVHDLATRSAQRAASSHADLTIATIILWLR